MVGRLRAEVAEQLAVAAGDARMLLWLADRLGLAGRDLPPPVFDLDAFNRRNRARKKAELSAAAADAVLRRHGLDPAGFD